MCRVLKNLSNGVHLTRTNIFGGLLPFPEECKSVTRNLCYKMIPFAFALFHFQVSTLYFFPSSGKLLQTVQDIFLTIIFDFRHLYLISSCRYHVIWFEIHYIKFMRSWHRKRKGRYILLEDFDNRCHLLTINTTAKNSSPLRLLVK